MRPSIWLGAGTVALLLQACGGSENGATGATPGRSAPAAPFFVGVWAARPDLCPDLTWRFEADRVVTAGEVACWWDAPEPTADDYLLAATCVAEAPPAPAEIRLAREVDGWMSVESAVWGERIVLQRCGGRSRADDS